ncbi:DUF84 family protein [Pseudalkalibacillus hwajinpoensis]|uniref:DUF84 family protein n=1 Tax=Guptibacillus hwajinpoensis TaxID=208199 RepID=UPI001CFC578E|nr:DUF84 family protein [Pseudalkalibacillus hwajinpoensis]
MNQIVVGSQNPVKINAVKAHFHGEVIGVDVDSGVADQPWGDEETLLGAKQRARAALDKGEASIGIGLEGGVQVIENILYVCNWGALVDKHGAEIIAGGARFPLPENIKKKMEEGQVLGPVISEYASRADVSKKEGAIGIFTDGTVSRTDMYEHLVSLLFGQYQFQLR